MEISNELLNSLYYKKYSEEEYKSKSIKTNYQDILRELADGYTLEQLLERGVSSKKIEIFMEDLKFNNLSVENVKAINQYSNESSMILSIKKSLEDKSEIRKGIDIKLNKSLEARGLNNESIQKISNYIGNLDYNVPLYKNYDIMKDNIDKLYYPNSIKASVLATIKDINNLVHIDKTINSLDDVLSKSSINESLIVYRALKNFPKEKLDVMNGITINNKGYMSTTPVYESSFAKYSDYNTVMEIYIPKGTQGIDITRFSDYDNVENEILLNENDLTIFETKIGVIDKNGEEKNIIKGYVLSKKRDIYDGLYNNTKTHSER